MYHSIIIRVEDSYYNTWDDWHLIPSSRPVIAPAKERTNFVTVNGRDGVLDFSQTLAGKPTFDNRSGSIEFYVENGYWDWETAYTAICGILQGKRVQLALEDNPAHSYEGLLYVDKWSSEKGHSKITLKYDLHPTMTTLPLESLLFVQETLHMTPGMVTDLQLKVVPGNTFYRKVNITTAPAGIVEVTEEGLASAIQNGAADIRAVCGPLNAVCHVEVTQGSFWDIVVDPGECSRTNHANKIQNGTAYLNILTAPDGFDLEEAVVQMGGIRVEAAVISADRKKAEIRIPAVSGDISIQAVTTTIPHYDVTWELDCATTETPLASARKGDTVTFKMAGLNSDYLLDNAQVWMNDCEQTDSIVWKSLREAEITLTIDGPVTIRASALAGFTLEECSWGMIDRIARSGRAAEYFDIGDRKSVEVRTGNDNALGKKISVDAIILGFNHDPTEEGAYSIHFCLGRIGRKLTSLLTNCSVNSTPDNAGGILGSELMGLLGKEPAEDSTILRELPDELTRVLWKVPKTVYDTTEKTIVTAESFLWLLSETEVFGKTINGYAAEADSQKQYEYFIQGNWTKVFDPSGTAAASWLRSPARDARSFCRIKADGTANYGWAYDKQGALIGFALGTRNETAEE